MRKKRALLKQGIVRRDTFWDKILAPIQGKLGGRVHTIVCGAAPLNPEGMVTKSRKRLKNPKIKQP